MLKASYPPFILELFLWGIIKDEESECVLNKEQGEVVFTLRKADFGILWPSLVVEGLDKAAKKERRLQAFEQAQALTEERAKARSGRLLALYISYQMPNDCLFSDRKKPYAAKASGQGANQFRYCNVE